MENIKNFGDLIVGDTIYRVDIDSGTAIPEYIITKIILNEYNSISFECNYYESKYGKASYSSDIKFSKYFPYYIYRDCIYLSDKRLEELCRCLVTLKIQCMAEKFNNLFNGLFKIEL